MNLLEVAQITKTFGGVTALNRIDLTIKRGEILGIIGPNGAGKTTLFNCITGFLVSDSGSIILDGHNIRGLKPFQIVNLGLTRTWQLPKPFFGMSVIEATMVPTFSHRARATNPSKRDEGEIVIEILKKMGLERRLTQEVDDLTPGEMRLLDISCALLTHPKVLLLDEPFSGLSHNYIENISDVLRTLNNEGLSIVIIEHRLRELMRLVQNLIVFNFGEKIAEGAPGEIVQNRNVIEAYLGKRRARIGSA